MKILLTGATGMIARAIRRVGAAEHEFVLMDVSEQVLADGGLRASVTDREAVFRAAEGCEAIIHTAAVSRASFGGKPTNAQFIEANVIGADHLFQAALRHGIRRLVMSSTMEILWGDSNHYGKKILDEAVPPHPDNMYALSKLQAELMGSYYAQCHGLEVTHLRYAAVQDKPVHEIGFTLLSHRMTAVDVARLNLLAATRAGLCDEVFCVGPESPLSQDEVDRSALDPWSILERHWPGCAALLRAKGLAPAPRDFWPVIRIDKAKRILGWQPESRFENYLRHLGWAGQ
jgi:nucleoside-diphosphate-sugar epimerase